MGVLSTEDESGVLVITINDASGFDNPNSETFRASLLGVLQANPTLRIAMDLVRLDTLSSSGIVALLTLKRLMEARHGRMILFGIQAPVFQVFKTLGLADFFTIVADRSAAIAALRATV